MAPPLRLLLRSKCETQLFDLLKITRLKLLRFYCNVAPDEEFRVIEILPKKKMEKTETRHNNVINPPRTQNMTPDLDWTNVWPGPKTFHPASVPLPLLQGCNKHGPPPGKFANTELMKIPNFLHLTPPAIEKHCEALKQFCTPWPKELNDEEKTEKLFPVEVISSDYCHSSPSIRDPLSRIINLRVKLKNLNLDAHAKDKFLRLVGNRYDPETDYVTITTAACPLKKQNYDYAYYLLTALYFESWKFEDWEKEKGNDDMETYIYPGRESCKNVEERFEYNKSELPSSVKNFGKIVENWHNEGDNKKTIQDYKEASLSLLSLPQFQNS